MLVTAGAITSYSLDYFDEPDENGYEVSELLAKLFLDQDIPSRTVWKDFNMIPPPVARLFLDTHLDQSALL